MKIAKILWSLGSLLVNVTILIYIALSSNAPADPIARHDYINENWQAYGVHWRAEFLFMAMIAIGAVYFAVRLRNISWSIISVGQLILLLTYPIMLGGYRNTPYELAEMANQMAIVVFLFGNVVFFAGLVHLYLTDSLLRKWLRYAVLAASLICTVAFSMAYLEIISWKQALMVGPLANIVYLVNAYYGLKIKAPEVE